MRVVRLPKDAWVVRVCKPSAIGDDGRPDAGAFELRVGESGDLKETALSVDWLEYHVASQSLDLKIDALRTYRAESTLPEFEKKRATAWLLAMRVSAIEDGARIPGLLIECQHDPRTDQSACQCDEFGLTGRNGRINPAEAVMDSHSLICPFPKEGPIEFAMMVRLRDLVEFKAQQRP